MCDFVCVCERVNFCSSNESYSLDIFIHSEHIYLGNFKKLKLSLENEYYEAKSLLRMSFFLCLSYYYLLLQNSNFVLNLQKNNFPLFKTYQSGDFQTFKSDT